MNYANIAWENRVTRVPPTEKLLKTSIYHIKQMVTAELEREFEPTKQSVQRLANLFAPIRTLIEQDQHAVTALDEIRKLAKQKQQQRIEDLTRTVPQPLNFSFTANPGFDIIVPPYDVEWSTGALSKADKASGKFGIQILSEGFNAAGVGVFLSSSVKSLVRFSPMVPFDYSWTNSPLLGPVSSQGSIGVVAFYNEKPQPFLDRRAVVWNDTREFLGWPTLGAFDSGSSFFAQTLGDVLILMEPGNTYLVWIWCWGFCHLHQSAAFADISCTAPFIVVDSGPAPIIA